MTVFTERLRTRIEALGLSHAEVARRTGLDARRFGHYVTGHREPNFRTLLRIADTLATTPDDLLGIDPSPQPRDRNDELRASIGAACAILSGPTLEIIAAQLSAVVSLEQRQGPRAGQPAKGRNNPPSKSRPRRSR